MKKIVFMIFLISASVPGQELPNVLPQSPEAASIGKYGQVPVGLFTGTPQLSIPIYQFKSGVLSLPISLNYSSNGIRVDEYASSVGLGWNLSAGGVITRSMYGKRDENQYKPASSVDLNNPESQYNLVTGAADPSPLGTDTQPDIFSFNFNGYSGKFYLDDNATFFRSRNVVFLEPSPLKVELLNANPETHFRITDPTGIEYYFGGTNAIEKFKYDSTNQSNDGGEPDPLVASAWYLTKITHPSGDEINLSYITGGTGRYENSISQIVTREDRLVGYQDSPQYCVPTTSDKAFLNIAQGNFSYLSEISSPTVGKIVFQYSQKEFMPSGFDKLDNISIRDYQNTLIKNFDLDYLVVNSSNVWNSDIQQKPHFSKRYFLDAVTEKSSNGNTLNPYRLTYNNPQGLPARFSYTQDYWGFYNGKTSNRNLIDQKTIDRISGNFLLLNALNNFSAADRNPNPTYADFGMLKRIVYPTKGSNEFTYEGHAYYGEVRQNPPYTKEKIEVTDILANNSLDITNVVFDHKGWLSFGANLDDFFLSSDNPNPTLDFNIAQINIYDITTGTEVLEPFYFETDIHSFTPFNPPYGITNRNFDDRIYVHLKKGRSYRFKINLAPQATLSSLQLKYYNEAPIVTQQNIPVGGMRIAQVKTLNGEGKTEIKNYHYGTLDCLDCDSGSVINRNIQSNISSSQIAFCGYTTLGSCIVKYCGNTTLSSNTAFPIYGSQGYHIGYRNVVEEFGNDFKAGALEHQFEGNFTIAPNIAIFGDYIAGSPYSNFFGFGRQKQQVWYAKKGAEFKKVQEVKNEYNHNSILDKETVVYTVRRNTSIAGTITFGETDAFTFQNRMFDITQYSLFRQWHVLDKKITKQYDQNGENPLTTKVSYFYDNEQHLQQTRTETTDSNGHILKTRTLFPQDIADPLPIHQQMINNHQIAVPVQVENYRKEGVAEELISSQHTLFKDWGDNLILPEAVQTLKGAQSATNTLEDRIEYLDYDTKGNPLEVSKTDGSHIIYIWGYNDQYPIAKIDNATYTGMPADVTTLINQIRAASNTENSVTVENSIRAQFDVLRAKPFFKDSQITSYTYDPLIGVTSMTDPRGYTVTYHYDAFNRLEQVKDKDGNILSENEYHYKNN